jgi:hypothetical protein
MTKSYYTAKRIIIRNADDYHNALYVINKDKRSDKDYTLEGKNTLVISEKIEKLLDLIKIDYGVIQLVAAEVEESAPEYRPSSDQQAQEHS